MKLKITLSLLILFFLSAMAFLCLKAGSLGEITYCDMVESVEYENSDDNDYDKYSGRYKYMGLDEEKREELKRLIEPCQFFSKWNGCSKPGPGHIGPKQAFIVLLCDFIVDTKDGPYVLAMWEYKEHKTFSLHKIFTRKNNAFWTKPDYIDFCNGELHANLSLFLKTNKDYIEFKRDNFEWTDNKYPKIVENLRAFFRSLKERFD